MASPKDIALTDRSAATKIGASVRERRNFYRLTQQDLALMTGVSDRTIRELEKGRAHISLASLLSILTALGLRIEVHE